MWNKFAEYPRWIVGLHRELDYIVRLPFEMASNMTSYIFSLAFSAIAFTLMAPFWCARCTIEWLGGWG